MCAAARVKSRKDLYSQGQFRRRRKDDHTSGDRYTANSMLVDDEFTICLLSLENLKITKNSHPSVLIRSPKYSSCCFLMIFNVITEAQFNYIIAVSVIIDHLFLHPLSTLQKST